jgi:hypothetical protein
MIARSTTNPETVLIDACETARQSISSGREKRCAIRRAQEPSGAIPSIQEKRSTPVFPGKVKNPRYLSTCQAPPVGLEPTTSRLIRRRRTGSTNLLIKPRSADARLQPLFSSHGLSTRGKLLAVDKPPRASLPARVFRRMPHGIVVFGESPCQIFRLPNVSPTGAFAEEHVNEKHGQARDPPGNQLPR